MENKLNHQEISLVFAMYLGQEFQFEKEDPETLDGITTGGVVLGDQADESGEATYGIDDCKLLLTNLADISDEDAIQIATMCEFTYSPSVSLGKEIVNSFSSVLWTESYSPMQLVGAYQFLIFKGYSVPLWFDVDHWANSKTAIELGIAIDKK